MSALVCATSELVYADLPKDLLHVTIMCWRWCCHWHRNDRWRLHLWCCRGNPIRRWAMNVSRRMMNLIARNFNLSRAFGLRRCLCYCEQLRRHEEKGEREFIHEDPPVWRCAVPLRAAVLLFVRTSFGAFFRCHPVVMDQRINTPRSACYPKSNHWISGTVP